MSRLGDIIATFRKPKGTHHDQHRRTRTRRTRTRRRRPNPVVTLVARWVALAVAHTIGFSGAIVLAFHTFHYDTAPIIVLAAVGISAAGIGAAAAAAAKRNATAWLIVASAWIYDAVIAGLREPTVGRQWGYALLFAGYGVGALATFLSVEWRTR